MILQKVSDRGSDVQPIQEFKTRKKNEGRS